MKPIDIFLIVVIAVIVIFAIRNMLVSKKKCCDHCEGCHGFCDKYSSNKSKSRRKKPVFGQKE